MLTDKGSLFQVFGFYGFTHDCQKAVPCSKKRNYRSPCALHAWQIKEKTEISPPCTMEVTQLPLPVLHRCSYHHSLHSEVTPDMQNNSDQSCLQVRQENTQAVFKTPHPETALSYRVMHAAGLQETVPIRKHNSIQQKVAKLSLD